LFVLIDDDSLDLLPEFCIYEDEGCELAESCLECPFSQCIEERRLGRSKRNRKHRDKEIVRLRAKEKKTIREIASICNVGVRTVNRALKHHRRKLNE
jgi:DNA-directed RNA polymerase specialized sigma subunit